MSDVFLDPSSGVEELPDDFGEESCPASGGASETAFRQKETVNGVISVIHNSKRSPDGSDERDEDRLEDLQGKKRKRTRGIEFKCPNKTVIIFGIYTHINICKCLIAFFTVSSFLLCFA